MSATQFNRLLVKRLDIQRRIDQLDGKRPRGKRFHFRRNPVCAQTWRKLHRNVKAERKRLAGIWRRITYNPIAALRYVFGPVAPQAIRVAACESGGHVPANIDVDAKNGQYLGMMQMGSAERRTYGHGPTALDQARAAYRYWRVAGWGPWSCKP